MSGKPLYLASGDDQNLNSGDCARQIYRQSKECGREDLLECVVYPRAGHLLESAYTNSCKQTFSKAIGFHLAFVGDAIHHAKAQEYA